MATMSNIAQHQAAAHPTGIAHDVTRSRSEWRQWNEQKDEIFLNDLISTSQRFSRLRPEVIPRFLAAPGQYDYMKKFSVQHLKQFALKELNILTGLWRCDPRKMGRVIHNPFSWSYEDFLVRRNTTDMVWLSIMYHIPAECVKIYKFQQDVEEAKKFVTRLFEGIESIMEEAPKVDIEKHVVEPINNAKYLIQLENQIDEKLRNNNRRLWELWEQDEGKALRRFSLNQMLRILLETRIMNSHINNPIELRYQVNWHDGQVNQMQERMQMARDARQKDIDYFRQKTDVEARVNASCMDFYYTALDSVKNRVNQLQRQLEVDEGVMDTRILFLRARTEKMRDEWKFRIEEIARFHRELEALRQRKEAELQAKLEQRRLVDEALALRRAKAAKAANAKGANVKGRRSLEKKPAKGKSK